MIFDNRHWVRIKAWGKAFAVVTIGLYASISYAIGDFFNTKYVDCDTSWGLTINSAIEIADEGERIVVSGVCTENVNVDKGVTLDGRGTASIIPADTGKSTVYVTARNVVITGFSLEASTTSSQIHISDQSLVTVSNNQIGNGQVNVVVTGASLAELVGNRIHNSAAESVSVLENSTARIGFQGSLATPEVIPNIIENNWNGIVVARAHANIVGNQIINNQRNGVVIARSGTARVASNEIAGNNVGVVNITNGSTDLALADPNTALSQPNFGINRALSIYCNSGYIGDVIGPDFVLPGIQIFGTCINQTTP